jgi:hypothetical protein
MMMADADEKAGEGRQSHKLPDSEEVRGDELPEHLAREKGAWRR